MDSLLKQAIREEVQAVIGDASQAGTTPTSSAEREKKEEKKEKREERTVGRLSSLITRIRDGRATTTTPYSRSSTGSSRSKRKLKKVQVKYERFDPYCNADRVMKQSEGGGPRFIEVDCGAVVKFEEIKEKATKLYFDNNMCNFYNEHKQQCYISLRSLTGMEMEEDKNIWEYLKEKGAMISKTIFVLYSKLVFQPEAELLQYDYYNIDMDISSAAATDSSVGKSFDLETEKLISTTLRSGSLPASTSSAISLSPSNSPLASEEDFDLMFGNFVNEIEVSNSLPSQFTAIATSPSTHTGGTDNPTGPLQVQPQPDEVVVVESDDIEITVKRSHVVSDLIKKIENSQIINSRIVFSILGSNGQLENAIDGGGVYRDVLSSFWRDFYVGYTLGDNESVPCIRHDFTADNWRSVAHIIVKGYKDLGYFPVQLNKAFVCCVLFGETNVAEDLLMNSFLSFIPIDDANTLRSALSQPLTTNLQGDDDVLEVISSLGAKRCVGNVEQLKQLVLEIAHKEIIQAPSYIKEVWSDVFKRSTLINSQDRLFDILKPPVAKSVLGLFVIADDLDKSKVDAFDYLKKFVRGLSGEMLKDFLRFSTGADMICVENIKVSFNKLCGLERRFIAHTCGNVIEIPTTYEAYPEFKGEFLTQLKSSYWDMDGV